MRRLFLCFCITQVIWAENQDPLIQKAAEASLGLTLGGQLDVYNKMLYHTNPGADKVPFEPLKQFLIQAVDASVKASSALTSTTAVQMTTEDIRLQKKMVKENMNLWQKLEKFLPEDQRKNVEELRLKQLQLNHSSKE